MKNRRFSRQRERIYQALCATADHPTAQELYEELKHELPQLSLGTVYRNLSQLAQDGLVKELDGPQTHYDAAVNPHTHFRCSNCGIVRDMPQISYEPDIKDWTGENVRIDGYELTFFGLCPACAEKIKKATKGKEQHTWN